MPPGLFFAGMGMMADDTPIKVSRAPVLTLWAAVVAERLGHPPDTALSLASIVAGTAAQSNSRELGLAETRDRKPEDLRDVVAPRHTVRLLGKDIPVTAGADGVVHAAAGDRSPAAAAPVRAYLDRAFKARLGEARQAMEDLAATLPPDELNRVGLMIYNRFRPDVPKGVKGWSAKGELRLAAIRDAAG